MGLAQLREHLQAIHAGQQNVHQHHVKGLLLRQVQTVLTVLAPAHLKPGALQLRLQVSAQHGVVFDGQQAVGVVHGGIH